MDLNQIKKHINKSILREFEGKLFFLEHHGKPLTTDSFDKIKSIFKRHPRFYYFIIRIFSPVYGSQKIYNNFFKISNGFILNLGSGNQPKPRDNVFNIDMFNYENVDIVCDIVQLPFSDNTIPSVMNIAVLEHVLDPKKVISEIYRVLKPGGYVLSVIPFMQPFHASPHDYQRYTLPGIEYLHKDFEIIDSGVAAGPVSGFLWVFQETIASIMSLGNQSLRNYLYILIMLTTWPLKFIDFFVIKMDTSKNVASAFYVVGMKKSDH